MVEETKFRPWKFKGKHKAVDLLKDSRGTAAQIQGTHNRNDRDSRKIKWNRGKKSNHLVTGEQETIHLLLEKIDLKPKTHMHRPWTWVIG